MSTQTTMIRTDDDLSNAERYRTLLVTADLPTIEQAHADAFAGLTFRQRRMVHDELAAAMPIAFRPRSADPRVMAKSAAQAERVQRGFLERAFGASEYDAAFGGSMLDAIGAAVVSAVLAADASSSVGRLRFAGGPMWGAFATRALS